MRALPRLRREPSVAPPTTAPEIVHEVLDAPGEQLDDATRDEMESRFGYDFGSVRVHSDERAAQSAEAVEAAAWTVGDDVAFASGLYRPSSSAGRELLAHELAHVVEGEGPRTDSTVTLGRTDDPAERRAEARAASRSSGRPRSRPDRAPGRRARGGVLRRTTFGALLGGGIGAVGGAILGGLLGGPIGALVGGLVGFVAGAIVGEVATTKSRSLTQPDIDYAKDIYLDSIDYSQITITRDSVLALGAPRTIGNTIHLKSVVGRQGVFVGDTLELTDDRDASSSSTRWPTSGSTRTAASPTSRRASSPSSRPPSRRRPRRRVRLARGARRRDPVGGLEPRAAGRRRSSATTSSFASRRRRTRP